MLWKTLAGRIRAENLRVRERRFAGARESISGCIELKWTLVAVVQDRSRRA